jgi:hypothetical protein
MNLKDAIELDSLLDVAICIHRGDDVNTHIDGILPLEIAIFHLT